jgi:hypothetical protein
MSITFMLSACGGERVELKLNLEANATFQVEMQSSSKAQQDLMGRANITESIMRILATLKVDSVMDDHYIFSMRYDSVLFQTHHNMEDIPQDGNLQDLLSRLLNGVSFQLHVSDKWNIQEVMHVEEIMQEIIATFTQKMAQDSLSEEAIDWAQELIQEQFSKDQIAQMFQNLTMAYAGNPVKKGSKWNSNYHLNLGMGSILIKTQYRMTQNNESGITLTLQSDLGKKGIRSEFTVGPTLVDVELYGTQTGRIVLAPHTHWVMESTAEQNLHGNLTMKISEQADFPGLTIPTKIHSTTTFKTLQIQ